MSGSEPAGVGANPTRAASMKVVTFSLVILPKDAKGNVQAQPISVGTVHKVLRTGQKVGAKVPTVEVIALADEKTPVTCDWFLLTVGDTTASGCGMPDGSPCLIAGKPYWVASTCFV